MKTTKIISCSVMDGSCQNAPNSLKITELDRRRRGGKILSVVKKAGLIGLFALISELPAFTLPVAMVAAMPVLNA